jgi:SAM-dependent methyltransferase
MDKIARFQERYLLGNIPWDRELPPPEVQAIVPTLTPGRALDLGCGYGRAAIYLAQHGWEADGVDFVPEAIEGARQRAAAHHIPASQARFHCADVTRLEFLNPPYDYALDVGCLHSLPEEELARLSQELCRLLRPGALFMLFAHLRDPEAEVDPERPRGILEGVLRRVLLYGDDACLDEEKVEYGTTVLPDGSSYASAWFWLRRRESEQ